MNNNNKILSCEEANNLDMVDYFSRLGFEPKRISGHQYWFLSPLRDERTASFKINRNINCWYDFGEGKGGTLVDFGIRYFKCSVYEFLQQLFLSPAPIAAVTNNPNKLEEKESPIEITDFKNISSLCLWNYVKERKIYTDIASAFCKEISFRMNHKNYFAIGFGNDAGGYELRNSFFKGSTHPKSTTSILHGGNKLVLFEGFFDFLSYKTIIQKSPCINEDYCILNSLSFLDKAKQRINHYESSHVFFDRDKSGIKAVKELQEINKNVKDESNLYRNHKDLNEWLMQFGLPVKLSKSKGIRQTS